MPSTVERVPNHHGRGVTYYVMVTDADSHRPAWVKAWDTDEIPDWAMLYLLHDWACCKIVGTLRALLNIPSPKAHMPPKPRGPQVI